MALLIDNKVLFIHCAKTGGTFFRDIVNRVGIPNYEVGKKHSAYDDLPNPYNSNFDTVIGFIREPVSWYRSRWAYAKMTYFPYKMNFIPEARAHWMANVWDDNLNRFIEKTLEKYPNGIATKYFNEMLGIFKRDNYVHIYNYENLLFHTTYILDEYLDRKIPFQLTTLKPPLSSKHIEHDKISPQLIKGIHKAESKMYEYLQTFN